MSETLLGGTVDISGMVDLNADDDMDLLGTYLVQGEDGADAGVTRAILGAIAKANPRVKAAIQSAQAQRATVVREQLPTRSRLLPLGLDSGAVAIAAGAAANIAVVPQKPFRPERLVVEPVGAPSFLINNVMVGTDSQFVTAGAIPAAIFIPGAFGVGLKGDTANIGITITVAVTNFSAAAARFLGALLGTAVGYQ